MTSRIAMDRKLSTITRVLCVLLIAFIVMVGVLVHMQNSLVSATNELLVCERSGGIECHIERDGTEYNVYSW